MSEKVDLFNCLCNEKIPIKQFNGSTNQHHLPSKSFNSLKTVPYLDNFSKL